MSTADAALPVPRLPAGGRRQTKLMGAVLRRHSRLTLRGEVRLAPVEVTSEQGYGKGE